MLDKTAMEWKINVSNSVLAAYNEISFHGHIFGASFILYKEKKDLLLGYSASFHRVGQGISIYKCSIAMLSTLPGHACMNLSGINSARNKISKSKQENKIGFGGWREPLFKLSEKPNSLQTLQDH